MASIFDIFKKDDQKKKGLTFAKPSNEDGAIEVDVQDQVDMAGAVQQAFDLDRIPTNEYELLTVYRSMALHQEIDEAIQEIINEAIITDELKSSVSIVLDEVTLSEAIKQKIEDEFDNILRLLNFKNRGYNYFNKWYVDGKLIFHKVVDNEEDGSKGIVDVIPLDPFNIKLVREMPVTKKPETGELDIYDLSKMEEYFIYSKTPINAKTSHNTPLLNKQGVKIPRKAITYVTSGVTDETGKTVLSYLYKAIKPWNNLKLMEDALVIYRVVRAPERRAFYIDVGSLPKGKAEQYLKDIMNRFKNKIVYDAATGVVTSHKKYHAMVEDYWLPRREGGRGTQIETLPGGTQLGEVTDVEYFKNKLYRALNVPLSRFQQDTAQFNIGRTTEITRDEVKFSKFISRIRKRFSHLFDDMLKTQLVLKKIMTEDEWDEIESDVSYSFLEDNLFSEFKEMELLRERVETMGLLLTNDLVGTYYTHDWCKKNVLKLTDQEIEDMEKDKKTERSEMDDEDKPDPNNVMGKFDQDPGEVAGNVARAQAEVEQEFGDKDDEDKETKPKTQKKEEEKDE